MEMNICPRLHDDQEAMVPAEHRHFRGRPVRGFVAKVLSVAFGLVMCSAEHLAVGEALLFCQFRLPVVDCGDCAFFEKPYIQEPCVLLPSEHIFEHTLFIGHIVVLHQF